MIHDQNNYIMVMINYQNYSMIIIMINALIINIIPFLHEPICDVTIIMVTNFKRNISKMHLMMFL